MPFRRRTTAAPAAPPVTDPDPDITAPQPVRNRAWAHRNPQERVKHGLVDLSAWTIRVLIIAVGLVALFWVMGWLWSILLPIFLGLLLSTVLWPPTRFLRRWLPPALAAIIAVLALFAFVVGLVVILFPQVRDQADDLVDQAAGGLTTVQRWIEGPPLNLSADTLSDLIDRGIAQLRDNGQAIAGVVVSSLGTIGSAVVTLVLALVLTFFFLKDGPRFLPWLRQWVGSGAGRHFSELSERVWKALGQYVWSQAAVAAVDGLFIGLGVWLLGVPFAIPIAVLTFFGGFIPIVGAFTAGTIAVLVALVSNGLWTAVGVLAIVLVVQQLEGNVMQPILVGKTLKMHPAVVLTVVALGGTLFGIIGAFLSVPAVAVFQVVARYLREQIGAAPEPEDEPDDDQHGDAQDDTGDHVMADHDTGSGTDGTARPPDPRADSPGEPGSGSA